LAPASKTAVFALKFAISGGLLYFLLSKIGGRAVFDNIRLLPPESFVTAVVMYVAACYLSSLRWRLLIPYHLGLRKVFQLYMIGSFFNIYLPGIIGGDGLKAYYLSRQLKGLAIPSREDQEIRESTGRLSLARVLATENIVAVASVFMDRYVGMSALLFISVVAFPFSVKHIESAGGRGPVVWGVLSVYLGLFALSLVFFRFRIGDRLRVLKKAYDYLHLYGGRRKALVTTFLYSIVVQVLSILSVYVLARGLSLDLHLLSLFIFVPIIVLISFIPVSVSGLGVREGAFVLLLSTVGVPADLSVTLSLLWFLSVVAASAWGGLEYVRYRSANPAAGGETS